MKKMLMALPLSLAVGCSTTPTGVTLIRAPNESNYPTAYAPLNEVKHRVGTVAYHTNGSRLWDNKEHAYRTMWQQCDGQYNIVKHDYSAHPGTNPMHGGQTTDPRNIGGPRSQTFFIDFVCVNNSKSAY